MKLFKRWVKGFTLVELLVIIAIVGVLVGMILRCTVTGNARFATIVNDSEGPRKRSDSGPKSGSDLNGFAFADRGCPSVVSIA